MMDRFGRVITIDGNTYSVEGITLIAESIERAIIAFDGMAPAGWQQEDV